MGEYKNEPRRYYSILLEFVEGERIFRIADERVADAEAMAKVLKVLADYLRNG